MFDLVLRNTGIVDELLLAAQASCSLRFDMKFLRCGCAWVDDLYSRNCRLRQMEKQHLCP